MIRRKVIKRKPFGKRFRKFQRRRNKDRPFMLVNKGPAIVPDIYMCKLKYATVIRFTSTTGVPNNWSFSGNSLFDPDVTGSGQQPNGYDQLAALYEDYTVLGSSCRVQFISSGTTNLTSQFQLSLAPNVGTPTGYPNVAPYTYRGMPYSKFALTGNSNTRPVSLQQYISTAKIHGVRPQAVLDELSYSANVGSSPTAPWRWVLAIQAADESATLTATVLVDIVYYCRFSGRVNQIQST